MDMKEAIKETELELAIKYLNQIKHDQFTEFGYINQAIPLVIKLLQRGEKYKAMWNELEIKLLKGYFINHNIKFENCKELYKELKDIIEQKYFPKGKN